MLYSPFLCYCYIHITTINVIHSIIKCYQTINVIIVTNVITITLHNYDLSRRGESKHIFIVFINLVFIISGSLDLFLWIQVTTRSPFFSLTQLCSPKPLLWCNGHIYYISMCYRLKIYYISIVLYNCF